MRLRINENKDGSKNFYVLKSFRNDKGVSTTKIVEKLGSLDELSKLHEDPYRWAQEYVDLLNQKEKEEAGNIIVSFSPTERIEKGTAQSFNGGYLFLQKIYYEMRMDYICKKIGVSSKVWTSSVL